MRRQYYAKLMLRKLFRNAPFLVFQMITMMILFSFGLAIFSFGLNMVSYTNDFLGHHRYYQSITFEGSNDALASILFDLKLSSYEEKRIIYSTAYEAQDGLEIDLPDDIHTIGVFDKTTFILDSEENEKFFSLVDKTQSTSPYVVISYDMALLISHQMSVSIMDLSQKKLTITNGTEIKHYPIQLILNEDYTEHIRQFTPLSIFVNDVDIIDNMNYITIQYHTIQDLIEAKRHASAIDVDMHESVDTILNMASYAQIVLIITGVVSFILLIAISGLMYTSIHANYIDDMPFYTMLKLLGISNTQRTFFLIFKSYTAGYLAFVLAVFTASRLLEWVNHWVDMSILFGDLRYEMLSLNSISVFSSFLLITVVYGFLFRGVYKRFITTTIDSYYISELSRL